MRLILHDLFWFVPIVFVRMQLSAWPGWPRDMFKTRSARQFKSCVFEPPTRHVFSINTSSSNTLFLFDQISSQQQQTPFSVNQPKRKATPWMGLADIHIQGLWDAFPSLRNCPFLTIEKGHFKLAILFVAQLCYTHTHTHTHTRAHTYTHIIILLDESVIFLCINGWFYCFSI